MNPANQKNLDSRPATAVTEALGQSEPFLAFQERLSRVAPVNRPVLLIGERGTGKELAASRLHYLSNRWQAPMVALNCAALSASLIESELFGYEKGAFTGALQRRVGRFEAADRGTLFLDEIGSIPLEVQEKILRVVEYNVFERVGSTESVEVDVRIIAATNADLNELARKNRFKQDLLDRLSFEVLFLPPLRERKEDILLIASHFAGRMALELGWDEIPAFSDEALEALENHNWPGNIRELKNVVERAVYRSDAATISEIDFHPFQSPLEKIDSPKTERPSADAHTDIGTQRNEWPQGSLKDAVWQLKVSMMQSALQRAKYNQKKAARILGLTYHQFRGLYRRYQSVSRSNGK
ncbi:MAG: phage shock protein operon transcriptional activator [Deltaproteobacteria bacterium]|jgi:psp operon transcriptional activator|nr:phage shock protein operon transcriptional activator [Deltaproteobacteria bacterium]